MIIPPKIPGGECGSGADPGFRRGCTRLLLYFNTNKPHSFFSPEYQLYWKTAGHLKGGKGGAHPLHPPPRSAPVVIPPKIPGEECGYPA